MVELWKFGGVANTVLEEDLKLKQAGTSIQQDLTFLDPHDWEIGLVYSL
jgi:hypothetical protein